MLLIVLILTTNGLTVKTPETKWDFYLFVQLWPGNWLANDHIKGYNFTNDYYSIHGIWPQYFNNTWPQFCNTSKGFDIGRLENIYSNLTKYWTNFKNPKSFWKHEYLKHMTCINETDPYDDYKYFLYGLDLRNRINIYDALFRDNIIPSNDHHYSTQKIMNAIKKQYGTDVIITCSNGIIEEVRFCMTKDFQLFDCPANNYKRSCFQDNVLYNIYVN